MDANPIADELNRLTDGRLRLLLALAEGKAQTAREQSDNAAARIYQNLAAKALSILTERTELAMARGLIRQVFGFEAAIDDDRLAAV